MEDKDFKRLYVNKMARLKNISKKDRKLIHFKSINNLYNGLLNTRMKRKSEFFKILFLEYLDVIYEEQDLYRIVSEKYFKKYIHPIGKFLNAYDGYIYKTYLISMITIVIISLVIAFLCKCYYLPLVLTVTVFIGRFIYLKLKEKEGKIYGYKY